MLQTGLVLVMYASLHVSQSLHLNFSADVSMPEASLPDGSEDQCISFPWACEADDVDLFSERLMEVSNITQKGNSTDSHCPAFENPNVGAITAASSAGPVTSQMPSDSTRTYLFVLASPHTSSTGLFSLIATSPHTSTLCSAHFHACEGTWLLIRRGLMTKDSRWDQDQPRDWNAALDVYAEFWDSSQQVLIDKSPPNIAKAERIFSQLSKSGTRVKFIILTRSPCYKGSWWQRDPEPHLAQQMKFLMDAAANLPPSSYLHLRFEDLIRDPYGQAGKMLEFLPELRSLDPAKNGLSSKCSPACGSLVDYIIHHVPFKNQLDWVDEEWTDYMKMFGHV